MWATYSVNALLAQYRLKERFTIFADSEMNLFVVTTGGIPVAETHQAGQRKMILSHFHVASPAD